MEKIMTRKQITDAINGSNYQALLDIYNQYKIDKKFDQFFSSVTNPDVKSHHFLMLQSRVKEILRKLDNKKAFTPETEIAVPSKETEKVFVPSKETEKATEPQHPKKITAVPLDLGKKKVTEKVIIDSNPHINRDKLPEDMQKLYDDNGRMNQEMKSKHALLSVATSNEARKSLMDELCVLEETQCRNWETIDKWYHDNVVDPKAPIEEKPLEPAEIAKKIAAAKNYIARYDGSKKPLQIANLKKYKDYLTEMKVAIPKKMADNSKKSTAAKKGEMISK
jgi:Fe-S cluster assembly scaffold protein SufB